MLRLLPIKKLISAFLALVLFLTNVVLAHALEANLWNERQSHLPQNRNYQLAQTPTTLPNLLPTLLPKNLQTLDESQSKNRQTGLLTKPSAEVGVSAILSVLPHQFGTIRNIVGTTSNRVIVHLQDVHQNKEAQTNIGKTLQALMESGLVDLVALEGAFEKIDLAPFHKFHDQDSVRKVANYLFKENKISGPLHLALTHSKNIPPFVGVDDYSLYQANVEAYQKSVGLVKANKEKWEMWGLNLAKQKTSLFSIPLQEFDSAVQAYRTGTLSLGHYLHRISHYTDEISPDIEIFLEALKMESSMNLTVVEAERSRLIKDLVQKLDKSNLKSLMDHSLAYRSGSLPHTAFYHYLKNLCEKVDLPLPHYPHMDRYIQYVLLSENIDPKKLIKESKKREEAIYTSLIKTEKESRLIQESRQQYLVGKLLDFALTSEEWKEYKIKLGGPLGGRERNIEVFESFYHHAEARDKAISNNLFAAMKTHSAEVAVLITGGFHAKGIRKQLRNLPPSSLSPQSVGIVTFVPKITKVTTEAGSAYLGVFTQEKTPLEKLFEGDSLFLSQNWEPGIRMVRGLTPVLCQGLSQVKTGLTDFAHFGLKVVGVKIKKNGPRITGTLTSLQKKVTLHLNLDSEEEIDKVELTNPDLAEKVLDKFEQTDLTSYVTTRSLSDWKNTTAALMTLAPVLVLVLFAIWGDGTLDMAGVALAHVPIGVQFGEGGNKNIEWETRERIKELADNHELRESPTPQGFEQAARDITRTAHLNDEQNRQWVFEMVRNLYRPNTGIPEDLIPLLRQTIEQYFRAFTLFYIPKSTDQHIDEASLARYYDEDEQLEFWRYLILWLMTVEESLSREDWGDISRLGDQIEFVQRLYRIVCHKLVELDGPDVVNLVHTNRIRDVIADLDYNKDHKELARMGAYIMVHWSKDWVTEKQAELLAQQKKNIEKKELPFSSYFHPEEPTPDELFQKYTVEKFLPKLWLRLVRILAPTRNPFYYFPISRLVKKAEKKKMVIFSYPYPEAHGKENTLPDTMRFQIAWLNVMIKRRERISGQKAADSLRLALNLNGFIPPLREWLNANRISLEDWQILEEIEKYLTTDDPNPLKEMFEHHGEIIHMTADAGVFLRYFEELRGLLQEKSIIPALFDNADLDQIRGKKMVEWINEGKDSLFQTIVFTSGVVVPKGIDKDLHPLKIVQSSTVSRTKEVRDSLLPVFQKVADFLHIDYHAGEVNSVLFPVGLSEDVIDAFRTIGGELNDRFQNTSKNIDYIVITKEEDKGFKPVAPVTDYSPILVFPFGPSTPGRYFPQSPGSGSPKGGPQAIINAFGGYPFISLLSTAALLLILVAGVASLGYMMNWDPTPMATSRSFAGLGFLWFPIFPWSMSMVRTKGLQGGSHSKKVKGLERPREISQKDWKELTKHQNDWDQVSLKARRFLVRELIEIVQREKLFFSNELSIHYEDFATIRLPSIGKRLSYFYRYYSDQARNKDFIIDYILDELDIDLARYPPRVIRTLEDLDEYKSKRKRKTRLKINWEEVDWNLIKELVEDLAAQVQPKQKTRRQFLRMRPDKVKKAILSLRSQDFRVRHRKLGTSMETLITVINEKLTREKIPKTPYWTLFEKIGYLDPDLPTLAEIETLQDLKHLQEEGALKDIQWGKLREFNPSFLWRAVKELTTCVVYKAKTREEIEERFHLVTTEDVTKLVDTDWKKEIPGFGRSLDHLFQHLVENKPKKVNFMTFLLEYLDFEKDIPSVDKAYHIEDVRKIHAVGALKGFFWGQLPKTAQRALVQELSYLRSILTKRFLVRAALKNLGPYHYTSIIIGTIGRSLHGLFEHHLNGKRIEKDKTGYFLTSVGFATSSNALLTYFDDMEEGFRLAKKSDFPLDEEELRRSISRINGQMRVRLTSDLRWELSRAILRAEKARPKNKIDYVKKWKKGLEAYAALLDTAEWMPKTFLEELEAAQEDRSGINENRRIKPLIKLAEQVIDIQSTTESKDIIELITELWDIHLDGVFENNFAWIRLSEIAQVDPPLVIRTLGQIPHNHNGHDVRDFLRHDHGKNMLAWIERHAGLMKGSLKFNGKQVQLRLKEDQARERPVKKKAEDADLSIQAISLINSSVAFILVSGVWGLLKWGGWDVPAVFMSGATLVLLNFLGLMVLNFGFYVVNQIWGDQMPTGPPISLYGTTATGNPSSTFIRYNSTTDQFELNPALYWLLRHDLFVFRAMGHFLLLVSFAFVHENLHRWGIKSEWYTYLLGHIFPMVLISSLFQAYPTVGFELMMPVMMLVATVIALPPFEDWNIKPLPFLVDIGWFGGSFAFAGIGSFRNPVFTWSMPMVPTRGSGMTKKVQQSIGLIRPPEISEKDWNEISKPNTLWKLVSKEAKAHLVRELLAIAERDNLFFTPEFRIQRFDLMEIKLPSIGKTIHQLYRDYLKLAKNKDYTVDYMLKDLGIDLKDYTPRVIRTLEDLEEYKAIRKKRWPKRQKVKIPWDEADWNLIKELVEDLAAQLHSPSKTRRQFLMMRDDKVKKAILSMRQKEFKKKHRALGTSLEYLPRELSSQLRNKKIPKTSYWYLYEKIGYLEEGLPTLKKIKSLPDLKKLVDAGAFKVIPWKEIREHNPGFLRRAIEELVAVAVYKAETRSEIIEAAREVTPRDVAKLIAPDWKKEIPGYGKSLDTLFKLLYTVKPKDENFMVFLLNYLGYDGELPKVSETFHVDDVRFLDRLGALKGEIWGLIPKTAQRALVKELGSVRTIVLERKREKNNLSSLKSRNFRTIKIGSIQRTLSGLLGHYTNHRINELKKPGVVLDAIGFARNPKVLIKYLDDMEAGFKLARRKDFPLDENRFIEKAKWLSNRMRVRRANDLRLELSRALLRAHRARPKNKIRVVRKWKKALEAYAALLDTAQWMPETFLEVIEEAEKIRSRVEGVKGVQALINLAEKVIKIQGGEEPKEINRWLYVLWDTQDSGILEDNNMWVQLNELIQVNPSSVINALGQIPRGHMGVDVLSFLGDERGQKLLEKIERYAGLLEGSLAVKEGQVRVQLQKGQIPKRKGKAKDNKSETVLNAKK
ncbi:hypothetical protein BVX98_04935 [bacterium F11]|nr:hypothetical protein BVX98_04935 [bacterium F11]